MAFISERGHGIASGLGMVIPHYSWPPLLWLDIEMRDVVYICKESAMGLGDPQWTPCQSLIDLTQFPLAELLISFAYRGPTLSTGSGFGPLNYLEEVK